MMSDIAVCCQLTKLNAVLSQLVSTRNETVACWTTVAMAPDSHDKKKAAVQLLYHVCGHRVN